MEALEQIRDRLLARFPGAQVTRIENSGPAAQHSLLLDAAQAREIATFLREAPGLRLDYCSNVTGVDWPEKEIVESTKTTVPDPAGGPPKIIEQKTKRVQPGCLEVVYHLYSMELKHGPLVVRLRTANRTDQVTLPSLTPVWRACEFQEREIFDLYGVVFEGHPDLRRILMWDEFKDHPMRKDYVPPDDFEWEPTPHGDVLTKAQAHYPAPASTAAPVAGVADPGPGTASPATTRTAPAAAIHGSAAPVPRDPAEPAR
jgi:NADH-quinone oxidoreductase subunit C